MKMMLYYLSVWSRIPVLVTHFCICPGGHFTCRLFLLVGVAFQRELEKESAIMGGGDFVVPAQTVPDFPENKLSGASLPLSSYRLRVKAACLHRLFPLHITHALRQPLMTFDTEIPGFISRDVLLHAVETRASAPVHIPRDMTSYESLSLRGLYPVGEGAGYAGGIVSADSIMERTHAIEDNWIPCWGTEFVFPLAVSELALLRIQVNEYDMSEKDDFSGQTCLPVAEVKPGIHSIPIFDKKGEKYKSVKFLLLIEFVRSSTVLAVRNDAAQFSRQLMRVSLHLLLMKSLLQKLKGRNKDKVLTIKEY